MLGHALESAVRVEWKKVEKAVRQEYEQEGYDGRFGPGLPGVVRRLPVVPAALDEQNESGAGGRQPLRHRPEWFTPLHWRRRKRRERDRRYVLENDLVEAIVGLPTDMFYNTGISTYVWILSDPKPHTARAECN